MVDFLKREQILAHLVDPAPAPYPAGRERNIDRVAAEYVDLARARGGQTGAPYGRLIASAKIGQSGSSPNMFHDQRGERAPDSDDNHLCRWPLSSKA